MRTPSIPNVRLIRVKYDDDNLPIFPISPQFFTNAAKLSLQLDKSVLVIEKVTYAAVKLSVLFFYRRIFGLQRTFRIVNDALIVLVIVWSLVFLFTAAFLCGSESSHGHPCAPSEWDVLWFAITDVLGDAAILALPYPCIRKLQMRRRDKWGLAAVFMLGLL